MSSIHRPRMHARAPRARPASSQRAPCLLPEARQSELWAWSQLLDVVFQRADQPPVNRQSGARASRASHRHCNTTMATAAAAVENLAEGTASLWVPRGSVPVLEAPPTALEFLRNYVHPSVPVLIRGALAGYPAEEWTLDTLVQRMGDAVVTVDVTPDGLGDAVKQINGAPTFVSVLVGNLVFLVCVGCGSQGSIWCHGGK
jgi:hypothetical protein